MDYNYDYTVGATNDAAALGMLAWMGAIMIPMIIIGIGVYIYTALALMKIADKTKTPNGWLAFIPIGNLYLLTQLAELPWWWLLVVLVCGFIPIIGSIAVVVISVWWFMKIAVRLGKPNWWGIMMIIPIVNLVFLYMMAWGDKK